MHTDTLHLTAVPRRLFLDGVMMTVGLLSSVELGPELGAAFWFVSCTSGADGSWTTQQYCVVLLRYELRVGTANASCTSARLHCLACFGGSNSRYWRGYIRNPQVSANRARGQEWSRTT